MISYKLPPIFWKEGGGGVISAEDPQLGNEDDERLLSFVQGAWRSAIQENFEGLFVIATLVGVGAVLYFFDQKISFLNLFFIPVLVAGCFMNTRSAVLGSLLAIAWVSFFAVLDPDSFSQEMGRIGLYWHLLIWGGFLVLTGAIVGRMTERLRARYVQARDAFRKVASLRGELQKTNDRLEERNLTLEVTKAKVESVLYATMDPSVAKLIIDRRLRNEKRSITVLFADLADFTKTAEGRPPESVIEDLNRLFSEVEPILTQFRGHLDKYLGDGLMAEFGAPFSTQHHQLLAVMAGMRMQARLKEKRFPGEIRIGIASGTTIVGLVGSEHRKNYTAIGDTVNLASRLEEICPVNGVLIDETVYERVSHWFNARRIRVGLSGEETKNLEARLEFLQDAIAVAPTSKLYQEAANLCSDLGDMSRALDFHRKALELDPTQQEPQQRAITAALLTGEERGFVTVKGKKERVAVFEVIGLRDPLDDPKRVPTSLAESFASASKGLWLPREQVLSVEAVEGSIGHAAIVAAISSAMGRKAGLDERELRDLILAAFLHDIGKRSVPEYLLAREGLMRDLPPQDQELIRSHVEEAETVISDWGLPRSETMLRAIREHHERPDGSGYPRGLEGADICIEARIIQIADTYETLTGWRPFQEPLTPRAAVEEIRREADEGGCDAKLAEIFLELMKKTVA
ncbi:MAG: hypothetical protein CO113_17290 [Elusimicrobia bacterium CG_4_9_14_3_um_filter_62_55]|nr:MAG: hypothetical protein COR54_04915 [Elusimicrobia bacterium CG22_combo_CG10-13_8_21_14_all_63_91]PJA15661.1 MAG: hypothetical protein COX66_09485 [Elusimicrobia bacterium CG_4_10_14_0_2_um_filter_63_34]PJB23701.1 MAG: hypothetical protein CO113_17290 [Elusimicrobia bacterium CG_4_9_14_3_um_filter_62_55]